MSKKYQSLLSPIKVGNVVFKNRLIAARSSPGAIQGSETYPTEALVTHYANKAKNGAAVVTCGGVGMPLLGAIPDRELKSFSAKRILPGFFDIDDANCQRYLAQLAEAIHFYGGKASMQINGYVPVEYDVSTGIPCVVPSAATSPKVGKEIPAEVLEEVADDYVRQAAMMQAVGFDMVYIHMAYRARIFGRLLSPLTNKRTDQYGGSLKNRARFSIMVADRIKQKCGKDFLIEAAISGCEPPGGFTLEDAIEYAKMFAGHIDLLQIRAVDIDSAHPIGYNPERTPFLPAASAVKKSGADIAVVTVGGYLDLDVSEDAIASGKADFIAMARGWISNPDFGRLAYEGRNEDVVPCIRCNLCLRSSKSDPPTSVCSVNPIWGLEHKIERMVQPPTDKHKVAVVGGGPAGMEAALIAAGRGHQVTLYEKSKALGGLLKTCDYPPFKWPQKEFKDYLVRQVTKSDIKVCLNTEPTAEMLKKEKYDAVLVGVGSEPIVPRIPGIKGKNVVYAPDVYGNEAALAKNVAVIGGGEVGVETGLHLAQKGHKVTLLEMLDTLAPESAPLHFYDMFKEVWEKEKNFKYILQARCTGIGADKVTYVDAKGAKHDIKADSVVIAVGMKAKNDLAMKFSGAGDRVLMVGDCDKAGNVQKAMRSAFSIASML